MRMRRKWFASCLICLLAGAVRGVDMPLESAVVLSGNVGLRECFDLALRHSKEVAAAVLAVDVQRARVMEAEGVFDPRLFADGRGGLRDEPVAGDPEDSARYADAGLESGLTKRFSDGTDISVSALLDGTDDRDDAAPYDPSIGTTAGVTVSRDLLRNAGREVNRTAVLRAEDAVEMALQDLRASAMAVLFEVEQAYWALYFAAADLRVRDEQLARANRLVAVAEAQVRVGQAAPIEVTRARSSAASQMVSIVSARNRIPLLRHRLLRAIGILDPQALAREFSPADVPGAAAVEAYDLSGSLEVAYRERPDLVRSTWAVSRASRQERYAENQVLPLLQVYGGVSLEGLDESLDASGGSAFAGEHDSWVVGVRLEVPLGNRAARGAFQAARLERMRVGIQRRALLEDATREVADAYEDLVTAALQLDTTRQSRELAAELLEAEAKTFELGRSSSLDVLDAQQSLASAEREEVRARVTYATALSLLLVVRGDFLERKGIEWESVRAAGGREALDESVEPAVPGAHDARPK
ncbi:MAG: TolC family protein [Lentisphaeria bacterium]|nr:TolC family protein [Lentisphaeria bacterium]